MRFFLVAALILGASSSSGLAQNQQPEFLIITNPEAQNIKVRMRALGRGSTGGRSRSTCARIDFSREKSGVTREH